MKIYNFNSDGWATTEYRKRDGILPDGVYIIPAEIPVKLAFYDGENIIAKTQAERDSYDTEQAVIAEIARQAAKPEGLKIAENEYLALLASLPIIIEAGDNSDTIIQKLESGGMTDTEAVKIGLKLLNAIHEVEIKGGSWYDLPSTPHNLEI